MVLDDECQLSGECVRICQSGAREIAGKRITVVDLVQEIEKDTIFYDESGGGVTFSGGEPFMQPIYLQTLLRICNERRIHTAVETCGYVDSTMLLSTTPYVGLYLYDLKVIDDEKHQSLTGVSNKRILENLRKLSSCHDHITIRFPVIPGVNDNERDVSQIGGFVSSMEKVEGIDILPYHKLGIEKYKRLGKSYRMAEMRPPTSEQITGIAERLRRFGVSVKIGG
jgi:pyruvate formate lyase activating enzyme